MDQSLVLHAEGGSESRSINSMNTDPMQIRIWNLYFSKWSSWACGWPMMTLAYRSTSYLLYVSTPILPLEWGKIMLPWPETMLVRRINQENYQEAFPERNMDTSRNNLNILDNILACVCGWGCTMWKFPIVILINDKMFLLVVYLKIVHILSL